MKQDPANGRGTNPDPEAPDHGARPELAFEERLVRVAAAAPGPLGDGEGETARVPATVLLTGESGSGKTRAAREFHRRSKRAAGPLVVVQLSGLSPTLLEAELFGHEAGAFTGASGAREGRFARAHGGTIVLEAVETLDLALQVKLLRVLQERVIEPVGSESFAEVDVQVIATTSRDLAALVEAGGFREDLYYRLAVVPVAVPPLRSRTTGPGFRDLCRGLILEVAARIGAPPRELSEGALDALAAHPWPGNFRELENALERVLVITDPGESVTEKEFAFLAEATEGRAMEIARSALAAGVGMEELEAALIVAALAQENDNLSGAARCVGLSRKAFDYRRKKLLGDR